MRIRMSVLGIAVVALASTLVVTSHDAVEASTVSGCGRFDTSMVVLRGVHVAMSRAPVAAADPTWTGVEAQLSITGSGDRRAIAGRVETDPAPAETRAATAPACDGVIRVAARASVDITLWRLFDEWGVRLTQRCIGDTCDAEGVRIVLDGRRVRMCPGAIGIADAARIRLSVDRGSAGGIRDRVDTANLET